MEKTFNYKNGKLYCEQVSISSLTKEFGTPLYVMSEQHIIDQHSNFESVFSGLNHLTCYAVKANFNLSIIRLLSKNGCGADVGSQGELFRALEAGVPAEKIIMSGVGKTREEIEYAIKEKILFLKVESIPELNLVNEIAKRNELIAAIALRINPAVSANTHAHIATGGGDHKFGIDEQDVPKILKQCKALKYIKLIGLDIHIGSQVSDPSSYVNAINKLLKIKSDAESMGFKIDYFDIGGGYPVTYNEEIPQPKLSTFAKPIIASLKKCSAKIIFEPGRYFVGNAGSIITKVLYIKENSSGKIFVVVDAGISELIRPVLYNAYHHILPVNANNVEIVADVVGPICESGDYFARDRNLSVPKVEELLAIKSTGAYASVMGNNYNGRLKPAEVLVSGKTYKLIRKRETLSQFIQNEI